MEAVFPRLQHTDLKEEIYALLKDKIIKGDLQPGQRLSFDEVARQMGVSRTPVKDALNRLAAEGLVVIKSRHGTFVSSPTAQDLSELFDLRLLLEVYAAERYLERRQIRDLVTELRTCMNQMAAVCDGERYLDYAAFIDGDQSFHRAIFQACPSERPLRMYESLGVHLQAARAHHVRDVPSARQTMEEHAHILTALEHRELDQVRGALTTHVHNAKTRLLAAVAEPSQLRPASQQPPSTDVVVAGLGGPENGG
jgi:DNA-binding GntR family transcriptional regulator